MDREDKKLGLGDPTITDKKANLIRKSDFFIQFNSNTKDTYNGILVYAG
mgnify:CR=1